MSAPADGKEVCSGHVAANLLSSSEPGWSDCSRVDPGPNLAGAWDVGVEGVGYPEVGVVVSHRWRGVVAGGDETPGEEMPADGDSATLLTPRPSSGGNSERQASAVVGESSAARGLAPGVEAVEPGENITACAMC